MKTKLSLILLFIVCFTLQGCAYELGYAAGEASRYTEGAGIAEAI